MVQNSADMGVADVASGNDICRGNPKVNAIFVAEVFNTKHGLELTEEQRAKVGQMEWDDSGSREERAFRMWMNSLGLLDAAGEQIIIRNLYNEASDGNLLCKVIDKVKPGSVEWNTLEKKADNIYKQNHNCNVAIESAKKADVKLIGVGAENIRKGDKKDILAVVWQLVRLHYLQLLGSKEEKDIIAWVNKCCPETPVKGWTDKNFASGVLMINLCRSIEPQDVDDELVTPGETDKDKEMNAKYAIALARHFGAVIFLAWDDIPNLNKKMILVFCASLYDIHMQIHGE